MDVTIRQATPGDLVALLRFQQGIVEAERPFDPTIKDGSVNYYDIAALISSPEVHFLVAECGANLVGCGFARIEAAKYYLRHPVHAYLGLMYVDPTHRGQAVNAKIIDGLKAWCRTRQITELRLEVYSGNRAAIRAYQKAGFAEHMLEMRLGLADGDGDADGDAEAKAEATAKTEVTAKTDAKGRR
jgi:GNAT superfamily N-acetyltransferase